jgi:hypothetical protein
MRKPLTHIVLGLVLLSVVAACRTGAIPENELPREELVGIQRALRELVVRAQKDPQVRWVHGWDGNDAVKAVGEDGSVMGYCWHWQERVYREMAPVVRAQGWDLVRININRSYFSEHHAVAVWDPRELRREELLSRQKPVWVLDPWLEGKPQILSLEDWLSIPVIVFEPAGLEIPEAPAARP